MVASEKLTKTKWAIDLAHSEIGFTIRHLGITNVKGVFREYESSIYTTGNDFMTAEIDFWMNPASIDTKDAKRDEHLRSPEFFDVEKYKEIIFTGNTYEQVGSSGSYKLSGDLIIKGVSKRIHLDVEFGGVASDPWGNEKAALTIKGKVNRKDWGLSWNAVLEAGGVLVSEDVDINCEIQLIKQA